MKNYWRWILIGLFPLIVGCSQVPLQVTYFDPVLDRPNIKTISVSDEAYASLENSRVSINAVIYEYNSMIALYLELSNKNSVDISPEEYSISLADGRDLKPIRLLKRSELVEIKAKFIGGGRSNALQDQLIEATMTNAMNVVNVPTKDKIIKLIDEGINQYFSFRPVYANATRTGVLCFMPDFKLEYPLTLLVKIKGEPLAIRFLPIKKP